MVIWLIVVASPLGGADAFKLGSLLKLSWSGLALPSGALRLGSARQAGLGFKFSDGMINEQTV